MAGSEQLVSDDVLRKFVRVDEKADIAMARLFFEAGLDHAENYTGKAFGERPKQKILYDFPLGGTVDLGVTPEDVQVFVWAGNWVRTGDFIWGENIVCLARVCQSQCVAAQGLPMYKIEYRITARQNQDIPLPILTGALKYAAHVFEHRGDVVDSDAAKNAAIDASGAKSEWWAYREICF